jgi:hypothetical protein
MVVQLLYLVLGQLLDDRHVFLKVQPPMASDVVYGGPAFGIHSQHVSDEHGGR